MTAPVGRFSRLLTTNSTIHNSCWGREKAVARLQKTVDNDEPVLIYGDYDVDGATGIAVLLARLNCWLHVRLRQMFGIMNGDAVECAVSANLLAREG